MINNALSSTSHIRDPDTLTKGHHRNTVNRIVTRRHLHNNFDLLVQGRACRCHRICIKIKSTVAIGKHQSTARMPRVVTHRPHFLATRVLLDNNRIHQDSSNQVMDEAHIKVVTERLFSHLVFLYFLSFPLIFGHSRTFLLTLVTSCLFNIAPRGRTLMIIFVLFCALTTCTDCKYHNSIYLTLTAIYVIVICVFYIPYAKS